MSDDSSRWLLTPDLPFYFGSAIGSGAYASVHLCRSKTSDEVWAVKFINKVAERKAPTFNAVQAKAEIVLHKACNNHANIIRFIDAAENATMRWLILEWAQGGDLFDKIEPDIGVSVEMAHLFFRQLMAGVAFIHSHGVAHRDIKPENILLHDGMLKISDFGLASLYRHRGKTRRLNSVCGSPPYVAPEILSSQDGYDGEQVDMWSCGVVLFTLLFGCTPWAHPTLDDPDFAEHVRDPRSLIPYGDNDEGGHSSRLWDLLQGLLCIDPERRLTMADVEAHAWMRWENPLVGVDNRPADALAVGASLLERLHVDLGDTRRSSRQQVDGEMRDDLVLDYSRDDGDSADTGTTTMFLSQFSQRPVEYVESLTQQARRFNDVVPAERMTRFLSDAPRSHVVPRLISALTDLGVAYSLPAGTQRIIVRHSDTHGLQLDGYIEVSEYTSMLTAVNMFKELGDPLEWRRFFKAVARACADIVYTPDGHSPVYMATASIRE